MEIYRIREQIQELLDEKFQGMPGARVEVILGERLLVVSPVLRHEMMVGFRSLVTIITERASVKKKGWTVVRHPRGVMMIEQVKLP